MIDALLLLLLLVLGIYLHRKLNRSLSQMETVLKEIDELKKLVSAAIRAKEPETGTALCTLPEEEAQSCRKSEPEEVSGAVPGPEPLQPQLLGNAALRPCELSEPPLLSAQIAPPPPPPLLPQAPLRRQVNYEKYIGENLFGKIGILILVIGMGLFVKYAIDNEWINETLRTAFGFVVSGILLLIAFRLKKTYRVFSSLLAGGAFAIGYVTIAIAYHYYELFSQPAAFVMLVALTLLMSVLAIVYDRRELAVIALTGGFIAPFLVSNGMGSYQVLFTYVLILDAGMFALSLYRKWGELPVICFAFTWTILGGYLYAATDYLFGNREWLHLLLFTVSFYLIFMLPVVSIVRINRKNINQLLLGVLALNQFVFLFFAFRFLGEMDLEQNYKGALTLFVALTNFALLGWLRPKATHFTFLFQTLLGLGLAFVSVTIPIQLEGTRITLFWGTEAVIVCWFYIRLRSRVYRFFTLLLPILTLLSYLTDLFLALFYQPVVSDSLLFRTGLFATGMYLGLLAAVAAWLLKRKVLPHTLPLLASVLIFYTAFLVDFYQYIHPALLARGYMQVFTAVVLCGLTLVWSRRRFPLGRYALGYAGGLALSVLWFMWQSYQTNHSEAALGLLFVFEWISLGVVGAHAVCIGRTYGRICGFRHSASRPMTLFLSIVGTVLLLIATNNLLYQWGLPDETNAGFSIALGIAGFIQMALGMRLHLKILRLTSLGTFAIVLFKLGAIDLWLLPTVGKIVIFILLGVILLVLSFLYQKLKNALFDDSPDAGSPEERSRL